MISAFLTGRWHKAMVALTATCFFCSMSFVPARPSQAMTLSEEKELGEKLLQKIKALMPLVEDGEVVTYIQSIGNRIAKQLGPCPYQFNFVVIDEPVPNAFAIPGGFIFVYRGLIERMDSEGEIAAVLSHELAHIQARHIQRQIDSSRMLSIAALAGMIAGVLIGLQGGGAAGQALAVGSMAGASSFQLKYSRENETEADQIGLKFLTAAGYRPEDMASAMRKLNVNSWQAGGRVPSYLMTHPAVGERVQYLEDLIHRHPSKETGTVYQGDFPIMKTALIADFCDTQEATERFKDAIAKKDPTAGYGMGRLYLRQGKVAEALPYLQEAARKHASSPFVLSTLGDVYYRQGMLAEARKVLESALLMSPDAPIAHFRLAVTLQDLGQKADALDHLYRIEAYAPSFPEIDYRLGVLLGQMNKLGEAHFYLGRYYWYKVDWKLSLFHYEKAKAMLTGEPQKIEEIDKAIKEATEKMKEAKWEAMRESQKRR